MLARNIHDEDTIELQLSATELELLNQVAAEAENAVREAEAPRPPMCATPVEPAAAAAIEAAPAAVPEISAAIPPATATAAAAETLPALAVVLTASAAATPAATITPVRAVTAAPTLVPVASPEHTVDLGPGARTVAPARATERARGSLQLVPTTPPPALRAARPTSGPQTLRTFGQRVFRPRAFGLRTAAALVSVAIVIAIALWPRTPAPGPAATPTTTPAQTIVQPLREPLREAPPAAAAVADAPPSAETPPMRFRNPFDSTEVFEFPAGTPYVDARDRVAQLLIARARERSDSRDASPSPPALASPSPNSNRASFARQL